MSNENIMEAWHRLFYRMASGLVNNIYTSIQFVCSDKFSTNDFAIKTVHNCSKLINKIGSNCNYVYNNYKCVQYSVDNTCKLVNYITAVLIGKRMEPYQDTWMSISWTCIEKTVTVRFFEKICIPDTHYTKDRQLDIVRNNYTCFFQSIQKYLYEKDIDTESLIGPLFIAKIKVSENDSIYFSRRMDFSNILFPIYIPNSTVKFISIQYSNEKYSFSIPIVLEREWFVSGNEILSYTFIMRYLEYQSVYYYLDEDYVLSIIDNDINFFVLESNQYILLTEDSYKIMTVQGTIDKDTIDELPAEDKGTTEKGTTEKGTTEKGTTEKAMTKDKNISPVYTVQGTCDIIDVSQKKYV